MPTDEIEVVVTAKTDQAVNGLKNFKQQSALISKEVANDLVKGFQQGMTQIAASAAAFGLAFKKAFDFVKEYAAEAQARDAMAKQFGKSSDEVIAKLNEVSGATISNKNLVLTANRAMALGVTTDINKMAKLLEYARLRAQALGVDTEQAFNDIVTGIGRASPLILDNLGIITTGWNEQAEAQGVAYDSQFILNKVLEDAAATMGQVGGVTLTAAERAQQLGKVMEDLGSTIGEALAPVMEIIIDVIKTLVGGFSELPVGMRAVVSVIAILIPAVFGLIAALSILQISLGPIGLGLLALSVVVAALTAGFIANANAADQAAMSFDQLLATGKKEDNIRFLKQKLQELRQELQALTEADKIFKNRLNQPAIGYTNLQGELDRIANRLIENGTAISTAYASAADELGVVIERNDSGQGSPYFIKVKDSIQTVNELIKKYEDKLKSLESPKALLNTKAGVKSEKDFSSFFNNELTNRINSAKKAYSEIAAQYGANSEEARKAEIEKNAQIKTALEEARALRLTSAADEKAAIADVTKFTQSELEKRRKDEAESEMKKKAIIQETMNFIRAASDSTFSLINQARDNDLAKEIKRIETERDARLAAFEASAEGTNQYTQRLEEIRQAELVESKDKLRQEKDAAIAAGDEALAAEKAREIEKLELAEQQKERDAEIQAEKDRLTAEADAKIRALKTDAAHKAKAAAIIQSIINTAIGVGNALQTPPWLWPLTIGMATATGVAQTALIASQPIPEFAEGGIINRPTIAQVGERGSEAIIPLKNGSVPVSIDGGAMGGDFQGAVINVYPQSFGSFVENMKQYSKTRGV